MKHCRDSARMIIRNSLPSSQAADPVSHKIFKKIFLVLAGLLALHSATAFAYCIDPLGGKIVFPSFKFNANSIPINGKIGNEIISGDIPVAQCGSPDLRRIFWIWGLTSHYVTSINGRNIYRTNTPGVGFSFGFEPGNFCQSNSTTWLAGGSNNQAQYACEDTVNSARRYDYLGRFHFQLYKIGNIANIDNNTISFPTGYGLYVHYYQTEWNRPTGGFLVTPRTSAFTITADSCTLQNLSPATVNLPPIDVRRLPALGSTAGNVPFSITVNCPYPTSLSITFTDNNKIGQTSNILSAASTSSSKGLGLQLQHNQKIISFGPDSSEPGTINQIVLNNKLTGPQTFTFTASYIRTGPITPGMLSAAATFTLSYQ